MLFRLNTGRPALPAADTQDVNKPEPLNETTASTTDLGPEQKPSQCPWCRGSRVINVGTAYEGKCHRCEWYQTPLTDCPEAIND